jgi:UDP-glucuronate decarboxylase
VEEYRKLFLENKSLFERLNGKTILITGASGLIGSNLVNALLAANQELSEKVEIVALVRNPGKARELFGEDPKLILVEGDVRTAPEIEQHVDYIIHAASQTSSRGFVEQPVETILTALQGTKNMLELAVEKSVESFVYLSTMEVYGNPVTDAKITETRGSSLDTMKVRSSYPESKRMCETLCVAYAAECGVPARVLRLTQTFGLGVDYKDSRVFAEFARCVIEGKNIVLKTKGETKRNYLYTADAVTAILTVLLEGRNGEAYNAANEQTYCSIYDMAVLVAEHCAGGRISVEVQAGENAEALGYAPTLHMNLDTSKLRALGWEAKCGLPEMFDRMIEHMRVRNNRLPGI